jgi:ATP/ADP translocase
VIKTANPTTVAHRKYQIRFWAAMAVYVATIWPITDAVGRTGGAWKIVLALTPLVPIAAIFIFSIQRIRGIDELERQIHTEALAIAAGVTALLSVTYGFLEIAKLPHPSAWFTYAIVMVSWGIATPFVTRKYKG